MEFTSTIANVVEHQQTLPEPTPPQVIEQPVQQVEMDETETFEVKSQRAMTQEIPMEHLMQRQQEKQQARTFDYKHQKEILLQQQQQAREQQELKKQQQKAQLHALQQQVLLEADRKRVQQQQHEELQERVQASLKKTMPTPRTQKHQEAQRLRKAKEQADKESEEMDQESLAVEAEAAPSDDAPSAASSTVEAMDVMPTAPVSQTPLKRKAEGEAEYESTADFTQFLNEYHGSLAPSDQTQQQPIQPQQQQPQSEAPSIALPVHAEPKNPKILSVEDWVCHE